MAACAYFLLRIGRALDGRVFTFVHIVDFNLSLKGMYKNIGYNNSYTNLLAVQFDQKKNVTIGSGESTKHISLYY